MPGCRREVLSYAPRWITEEQAEEIITLKQEGEN